MRNLIFGPDANTLDKSAIVSLAILLPLALLGLLMDFTPTESVKELAWSATLSITAVFGGAAMFAYFQNGRPGRRDRPLRFVFAVALMFFGCSWFALALGVGAAFTYVFGTEMSLPARVAHIPNPSYGRGCGYAFFVRYTASGDESRRLCAQESLWAQLRTGQEILVVQEHSRLGYYVVGFRLRGNG